MSYIGRTPTNAALTASDLADGIVGADKIASNAVTTVKINADAVTDAKIADDVVGTEHLTANEVDTAALGADAVTSAELADDAVDSEHYTDGSIDTAHLADGQVTIGKLATAVLTGATDIGAAIVDADLLLIDDGAGGTLRKTAASRLKTYIGANTPAFSAFSSADRAIGNNSATLVIADSESFDTDSAYNVSTYKFTPGVAGKYFLYFRCFYTSTFSNRIRFYIYKNGSSVAHADFTHVQPDNGGVISTIVTSDTDDYFQAYTFQDSGSSRNIVGGAELNEFGGYRIIT